MRAGGAGADRGQSAVAVRDLGFCWPSGEFWMLLGTNGSGKSTLLRLMAGLLHPQSGEIDLGGRVGFVFQNPDHQLVMPTVGADVAFGLVEEKLSNLQVRSRVAEALEAVNLLDLQRRPIYALSTALLDPDSQLDLVAAVQRLVKNRGITALWVTHRLDELNYCDGAFLLEKGQVVDRGDPARLKQRLMQSQDV
ncbi:MAG: ABC transporter ATP-binding protein [Oscillatoriales cyanobacterium]|nr:MAG: ABC transporter ATP-binding protein [Oscillatoriales cyanobacterium]